jgi:endonuclease
MKKAAYEQWLRSQELQENTINAQMYRASRVDQCCGDLDEHFAKDGMKSLIELLTYSTDDEHRGRPNPTPIPFDGNIRNNLASYRHAAERYRSFLQIGGDVALTVAAQTRPHENLALDEDSGQRIGLERDMQKALRTQIDHLESGLSIIDEGVERSVDSGFIDITARDSSGTTVVIELKAGMAGQRAVAQILSYMGDVATDEDGHTPRGILVASEFDSKAKAAAKMVPTLVLTKYSVRFLFSDGSL